MKPSRSSTAMVVREVRRGDSHCHSSIIRASCTLCGCNLSLLPIPFPSIRITKVHSALMLLYFVFPRQTNSLVSLFIYVFIYYTPCLQREGLTVDKHLRAANASTIQDVPTIRCQLSTIISRSLTCTVETSKKHVQKWCGKH